MKRRTMNKLLLACGWVVLSSCALTIQNDEMDVAPDMEVVEACIRDCTAVAEACLDESTCKQHQKQCLDVDVKCVAVCVEDLQ